MRALLWLIFLFGSFAHASPCESHLFPHSTLSTVDAKSIKQSLTNARAAIKKSKKGAKVIEDLSPGTDKIRLRYTGFPSSTTLIEKPETLVFRHYYGILAKDVILKTSRLRAGSTPYVFSHNLMEKEIYEDMTGIFFTTSEFSGISVGVSNGPYIEFKLYPGTGVLKVEEGIFFVPSKPGFEIPIQILQLGP